MLYKETYLTILLLTFSLIVLSQPSPPKSLVRNFSWLLDSWQRTDEVPGKIFTETWQVASINEWSGIGVTTQGADTIFVEQLNLILKNGDFYYVAEVSHNESPVHFKITAYDTIHFVAENPQHNFPKMIVYQKIDNQLKATISGDEKSIDFTFEKTKD